MLKKVSELAVAAAAAGVNQLVWQAIGQINNRLLVTAIGVAIGIPPSSETVMLAAIQATTGAVLTTGIQRALEGLIGRVNQEVTSAEINTETVAKVAEIVLSLSEIDLGFTFVHSGQTPQSVSESGDVPTLEPEVPFYRETWMKVLSYAPIIGWVASTIAKYHINIEVGEEWNSDHKIELIKATNQYSFAQIVGGCVFIAFVIMGCVLDLFTSTGLILLFTGMSIGVVGMSLFGLINNHMTILEIRNGTISTNRCVY